jgi:hypothetical protein
VVNDPINFIDAHGRERAQILLDQDIEDLLAGEITSAEYWNNIEARGIGAAVGAAVVGTIAGSWSLVANGLTTLESAEPEESHSPDIEDVDPLSQLSPEDRRSVRSLEKRLIEHREKLDAYREDPDAFDNENLLRDAPSEEIRERIIRGRIRHLEQEISSFAEQLRKLLGGG